MWKSTILGLFLLLNGLGHSQLRSDDVASPLAVLPAPQGDPDVSGTTIGKVVEITPFYITVQVADQKPIRYRVSDVLESGRISTKEVSGYRYRLADVQTGDLVVVCWDRIKKVNVCHAICIRRRPGGRVPQADEDKTLIPHLPYRYHERANAEQEWEEKGIPIPAKFVDKPPPSLPSKPD